MLYKFYYVNHQGEKLSFGENGIYANYNDLRDYAWNYDTENDVIRNFNRGVSQKTLPVIFCGKTGKDCRTSRNNAYIIAEKDVLAGEKGRIYIGNYYMNCWIYGISNSDYLISERILKSEFLICTDDPVWRNETTFEFIPGEISDEYGFEFPFEFPFDFQNARNASNTFNNQYIFDSDFILTFYGAAESPSIKIAGHTYGMTCNIEDGERIVIDSLNKKIRKYGSDNNEQNFFNYRYKEESIFEKIKCGINDLSWDGSFGFDIMLIDSRSEPEWTYTNIIDEIVDAIMKEDGYYLVDSKGDYILDSDGDYIVVDSSGRQE